MAAFLCVLNAHHAKIVCGIISIENANKCRFCFSCGRRTHLLQGLLQCFSNLTLNFCHLNWVCEAHIPRLEKCITHEKREIYRKPKTDIVSESKDDDDDVDEKMYSTHKHKLHVFTSVTHLMGPRCRHSVMWNSFMCTFVVAAVYCFIYECGDISATTCVSLLHIESVQSV